jgi:SAM-dependent methyltransferase
VTAGLNAAELAAATDLKLALSCRACGSSRLDLFLPLGSTPLANSLLPIDSDESLPLYPLNVVRCLDCTLVQLREIVAPERLFSEYLYFSSVSDALVQHARGFVESVLAAEKLGPESLVVEIASNDGYLLQFFKAAGIPVLGIEPAQNIARVAEAEKRIPTLARFFNRGLARELATQGRHADVIIGNNVLAHVPELNDFAAGISTLLKPTGVAMFEFPYLRDLLDNVEFDTIYHEHQCYYSVTALERLFTSHHLDVVDVLHVPVHGGSLRLSVAPRGSRPVAARLRALLDEEQRWGVDTEAPYAKLASSAHQLKASLRELLDELKGQGKRIAAYGAAAKGVTLTAFCGVGRNYLDYIVDRSPHKQGKRFPVNGLPIYTPEKLIEDQPDYTLLLTWNFATEILAQQKAYMAAGGKFIIPVPHPRIAAGD